MTTRDTEHDALRPILAGLDRLEGVVDEQDRTIKAAITALRQTMIDHYTAVQTRVDDHARRIQRIEGLLLLDPIEPDDPPRALPDTAA
jgi:hypothetical protein